MIKEKLRTLQTRCKPEKYKKYISNTYGRQVLDYEYYKCDYCGEEIRICNKKTEMTGGTVRISYVLTGHGTVEVALCNKCVKPAFAEFERR